MVEMSSRVSGEGIGERSWLGSVLTGREVGTSSIGSRKRNWGGLQQLDLGNGRDKVGSGCGVGGHLFSKVFELGDGGGGGGEELGEAIGHGSHRFPNGWGIAFGRHGKSMKAPIDTTGRLEPVQAYLKKNKRGLGAETKKPQSTGDKKNVASDKTDDKLSSRSKAKRSKRLKKALEIEKKLQENEFQAAFFREFWPDNV
ncbi:hypothetical protein Ccrd_013138 [Cynara cardunculus var. scolymus]|uniref:Uncharacterized protein n=1 Tax=Cynara cardunculus var. scolymus TaxID=59895 RepID=A0A103YG52_CYNCS|nr:hypothetical protein Ccrd_013138 [Cynara cardunculus var. scolymus]